MQRTYRLTTFLFYSLASISLFAQKPLSSTALTSQTNTKSILDGEQLFQTYCSACHNFLQKGIGPSLDHVMAEVPASQLKAFIRNAPEQISKGDPRANRLYKEYKQMMPDFSMLKETELDALLAYIGTNQKSNCQKKTVSRTASATQFQPGLLNQPFCFIWNTTLPLRRLRQWLPWPESIK